MSQITFSLIRKKNPVVAESDDVEKVDKIDLNGCNIHKIDNLEVFSHILYLSLRNNSITKIENISFLFQLQELDVSYNLITNTGLESSISEIPRCLQVINLTGNTCTRDEVVLGKLQDTLPDLGIAIDHDDGLADENDGKLESDSKQEEEEQNEDNDEGDDEETKNEDDDNLNIGSLPASVNADEILKYIVDRKCKLQSLQLTNIDQSVIELNKEEEIAIHDMKQRRAQLKQEKEESLQSARDSQENSYQSRIAKLQQNNAEERDVYNTVLERMRNSANEHLITLEKWKRERLLKKQEYADDKITRQQQSQDFIEETENKRKVLDQEIQLKISHQLNIVNNDEKDQEDGDVGY